MIPVNHPFETKAVVCVGDIVKSGCGTLGG